MKVAVCGTVGLSKSCLSCLLGEVPKKSGILKVCSTKAYVAQSPWIQSGKIEENILFDKEMDGEMYNKVLEACSLKKDVEILPFGDQTIIGERGINLSGGQKQRIQIARALYQDADIYLLDDPFNAVDAHIRSHLFKVMKDGMITQHGKYTDMLNSGIDLMEFVSAHKKTLAEFDSLDEGEISDEFSALEQYVIVYENHDVEEKDGKKDIKNGNIDDIAEQKGQRVQEEERKKGKVGFSIYWKYITTAYGGALAPFIVLAQILFQLLQLEATIGWLG